MGDRLKHTYLVADNIISSLGFSTQENIDAISSYTSGIQQIASGLVSDESILAGLIPADRLSVLIQDHNLESYSQIEQLIILSVNEILSQTELKSHDSSCGMIISTTKGNVDLLQNNTESKDPKTLLAHTAQSVAEYFNLGDRISIISNACISGVSALIVADRLLQAGTYSHVLVVGVDLLSHFISSGFLSFKSVSQSICKPYDASRDGLSLGEACGSVLLTSIPSPHAVMLRGGAISNDANHISGPSRSGDGLHYAMQGAITQAGMLASDIDFVNLHGTATVYNDEMEAKAIHLSGLESVPTNSLKPYFGHTLGASGIIETIACVHQLKNKLVFGTLGYDECGVSQELNISASHRELATSTTCLKTASGFGGCNAAIVLSYDNQQRNTNLVQTKEIRSCSIGDSRILANAEQVFESQSEEYSIFIREAYKHIGESNPKFYKMDDLSKLGYIAATHLLEGLSYTPLQIGIVLSNASSSLDTDTKYQRIIDEGGDKSASPAVFVYTLPNIVLGEICIHHKIQGENTFFVEDVYNEKKIKEYAELAMSNANLDLCIYGWCEYYNNEYKAEFRLLEKI